MNKLSNITSRDVLNGEKYKKFKENCYVFYCTRYDNLVLYTYQDKIWLEGRHVTNPKTKEYFMGWIQNPPDICCNLIGEF
jgi:hypothetical protein